jgi:hypothetical protein
MKAKNTNTLLKHNGNTRDIASAVISVYNRDYSQVCELAQTLNEGEPDQTCNRIFDYVIEHVDYKEDPAGVQWVKTPARLIADGFGDCKSMAIFIASCLRCLEIEHSFRFVSFNQKKEATHVYVIVPNGGDEIIIDPVVRVSGMPKFNHEEKYTYKSDMNGTNIYYMAGMPRYKADGGGTDPGTDPIEDPTGVDESRYNVWTGDENEADITPGKHFLYSRFDLLLEQVNIAETEKEAIQYYNQLDITTALLYAYNHVNGDPENFKRIAAIVCSLVAMGYFNSVSMVEDVRGDGLDEMLNRISADYDNGWDIQYGYSKGIDPETWNMLNVEVFPYNVKVSTIGHIGSSNGVIGDKIKSGGYYFLYNYIPDSELKNYPASVAKKRLAQNQVKSWLAIDLFHTEATRNNLIRSGIIARVGMTPEKYIREQKRLNIKNAAIGIPPEPISTTLETISLLIGILVGLIALIRAIFPPKNSPTNDDILNGAPNVNDELFTPGKSTGSGSTSTSSLSSLALPLVIGASVLYSMFKKKAQ